MNEVDIILSVKLSYVCTSIDDDYIAQMVDKLTTDRFQYPVKEFAPVLTVDDPNAEFQ